MITLDKVIGYYAINIAKEN